MSNIEFYTLKPEIVAKIRQHGLSKTESKLFFYLLELDPFGDRPSKVKVAEILLATGISKAAYHNAVSRFELLGFFDFKHTDVVISNLSVKQSKKVQDSGQVSKKLVQDSGQVSKILDSKSRILDQESRILDSKSRILDNESSNVAPCAVPAVSQTYSDLLQIDPDRDDDFLSFQDSENTECNLQGLTAIASTAIQVSKPDTEIEHLETCEALNKKRLPDISDITIEGDSFRPRVEDFILKEMKFSPRDRTAYFSKFSPQHWQDWESKYKAQFSPSPMAHKVFIPEIVEVAPPDSEAVKDALAQIRKSLGIKVVV